MAKKTKKNKSFSNGEHTHITFDPEGYIVEAQGFGFLLWSPVSQDINKTLIGKHVYELAEMFKTNGVHTGAYEQFQKQVVKKLKLKKRRFAKRLSK